MSESEVVVGEVARGRGRPLLVARDASLYVSRRYAIHRSVDHGRTWTLDAFVPSPAWRRIAGGSRIAARLLRHDVQALALLADGTRIAVARDGLYRVPSGERAMTRIFALRRGSRPLHVAVGVGDVVVFGEYGSNPARHEIHVYVSKDGGRHFEIGYTFPPGDVRHVHNLLWDAHLGRFWVLVGDYASEPGLGVFDADLSKVTWVSRGNQQCRAVAAIVESDALVFGTDTELEQNHIVRLEKATGRMTALCEIPGTSLYAARFGSWRAVTTCVEPSRVNRSREAALFVSHDGDRWVQALSYRKDSLPSCFQYGTIVLPHADSAEAAPVVFSGQAVSGLDDQYRVAELQSAGRVWRQT